MKFLKDRLIAILLLVIYLLDMIAIFYMMFIARIDMGLASLFLLTSNLVALAAVFFVKRHHDKEDK